MSFLSDRLFISGPRKSSGKTTVAIGLAAAFTRRGLRVETFKKGPDFIDPRWLGIAAGGVCHNLDFFMMGKARILENFQRYGAEKDLLLVEGNMGLFDGQELEGGDSGAGLAQLLGAPILLVVNCQDLARSVAPLVLGHIGFPGGERIAGVILNNVVSPRQEDKLRRVLDYYCPVPILGVLPRSERVGIIERHLGLTPAEEGEAPTDRVAVIGEHVARHVDLDHILKIAQKYDPIPSLTSPVLSSKWEGKRVRVGFAIDQAFHFYYPENLLALEQQGVTLVPISLLTDSSFPDVDGLYIGGGFPEMFMDSLAANRSLITAIRQAARNGMPIYAECGGLMYLAEKLDWQGRSSSMSGVLPIEVVMEARPQGHGYMVLEGTSQCPWPGVGRLVHCHEFHYSHVTRMGEGIEFAFRVKRGKGLGNGWDGLLFRNILASYAHIHADASPDWANFLAHFWQKGIRST
ncbi:MAG: hydrogenobyrinic acid a,c-diamide synthase (glutamine-hydrolyzing) [Magnetococcus sp. DMHC-6]